VDNTLVLPALAVPDLVPPPKKLPKPVWVPPVPVAVAPGEIKSCPAVVWVWA